MKIGFVGLGAMGFPMARHLAREHEEEPLDSAEKTAEKPPAAHPSAQETPKK